MKTFLFFRNSVFLMLMMVFIGVNEVQAGGTNATWTGNADNEWTNGANWSTGTYSTNFNATIPGGLTRYPVLTANSTCRTIVSMGDGASISGNFTLTVANTQSIAVTGNAAISCNLAGNFTYAKTGTGTLAMSGSNSTTAAITVSAGVLRISHASALGTTAAGTTVSTGAALEILGGITVGDAITINGTGVSNTGAIRNISGTNTISGNVTMASSSEIGSDAGELILTGTVSGTNFSLVKDGGGTLTLSGANTYTGTTTISAGTLVANTFNNSNSNSSVGTNGTVNIGATGILKYTGAQSTSNRAIVLTGSGGTIDGSGTGALTISGGVTGNTYNLVLSGATAGNILSGIIATTSGTVTKNGTGTWTLSGANTYTGLTTISAGTLKLGAAGTSPNSPLGTTGAGTSVSSGGTLDLSGFTLATAEALSLDGGILSNSSATAVNYSGAVSLGSASTVSTTGNITLGSAGISGSQSLTKTGAGTFNTGTGSVSLNNLTISAGTVTPGSGLTLTGNMDIGGTFIGGDFTHNVAGNWTRTGTFTATGTTINFNGASAQSIGAGNFNIVTFNGAGTKTATGALSITGNATIGTSSTFNAGNGSFTHVFQGSAWTNNGTFNGGNSTVNFNAAGAQSITGSTTSNFYNLNQGGAGLITLGINTNVSNTLSFTADGLIDLSTYDLTAGSCSGHSATRYVKTSSTGRLKQSLANTGTPVTKIYPVGRSAYNPASITNNTNNTTVNIGIYVADGFGTTCNDPTKNVGRRWFVKKEEAGTTNVTAALSFNSTDETGVNFNPNNIKFGYFSGTYWNVTIPTITGNRSVTTVTATGDLIGVLPDAYMVIGSDDAFDAKKFKLTVYPNSPIVNANTGIITVQSVNNNDYPTNVMLNTGFSITTNDNTQISGEPLTGTLAEHTYETTLNNVTFTQANVPPAKAAITATRTSGDALATTSSSDFDVVYGTIYRPKQTGNSWSTASGWEKSESGGAFTTIATMPTLFGTSELVQIPAGLAITMDENVSLYSLSILNNAAFDNPGSLEIASGKTLTCLYTSGSGGSNIHVHGLLKNSGNDIVVTNSTPIEIHGGKYLHNKTGGNIPVATWYSLDTYQSTCEVNGTGVGGLNQSFENFTLTSGNQTLAGNLSVSGVLTFSSGIITTGSYWVIQTINASSTGASAAAYVNGNYRLYVPNTTNQTLYFPIGDATHYAPATFTIPGSATGSGYIESFTVAAQPPTATGLSQTKYINRKWRFENFGVGLTSYNISLTFTDGDKVGNPSTGSLALIRYRSSGSYYTTNGSATGNTISATGLSVSGTSSYSDYYVGESDCSPTNAVWLGGTSTDWNTDANWCGGTVPTSTVDVLIPAGIANYPETGSTPGNCKNLTIESGAMLTITGSNALNIYGNLSNSGTFNSGTGTVSFVGSSPQTITGTTAFYNLTINNTATIGEGNSRVTIASEGVSVNGELTLTSANASSTRGTLETGTYTLNMGATATTTGTGDVTGLVKRTNFTLNDLYTFGSAYTNVSFTSTNNLPASLTCKISIGSVVDWGADWIPLGKIKRYYGFLRAGSSPDNVILTMRYLSSELDATNFDKSKLVVWHQNTAAADPTPHEHGKSGDDQTNNTVSFGPFTVNSLANLTNPDNNQWTLAYSLSEKNTWRAYGNPASSEWNEPLNWSAGHYPGQVGYTTDDVLIPSGDSQYPVLSTNIELKTLEIASGASVDANGKDISINGTTGAMICNGTFTPGTGTVRFVHDNIDEVMTISGTIQFHHVYFGATTNMRPASGSYIKISGDVSAELESIVDLIAVNTTVEYNGSSDQYIVNPETEGYPNKGYFNIKFSGTGTKFLMDNLDVAGDFTNLGTVNCGTGKVSFIGNTIQHISNTTATTFNNLTINNAAGVVANDNINVNGTLYLQSDNVNPDPGTYSTAIKGALDMGTYTVFMGPDATNTGTGEVTGTTARNYQLEPTKLYTFGHPDNTLIFASGSSGTLPSSISVTTQIGSAPSWKTDGIQRKYTMTETGVTGSPASTITIRYADSELNGNSETLLVPWYTANSSPAAELPRSDYDPVNNIITMSNNPFDFPSGIEYTLANTAETLFTWTGISSTDWDDPTNWSTGFVPGSTSQVTIPDASSTPYDPDLPSTTTISTIAIEGSGVLNAVSGAQLTLTGTSGTWNNDGIFNAGTSTVIFGSGSTATLAGNTDFFNLTIDANTHVSTQNDALIGILEAVTINGTGAGRGVWSLISQGVTVVNYKKEGAQTVVVPDASTNRYHCLTLSGSGVKTLPALTIFGDLTVEGSANATAGGALTIHENVYLNSGTFTAGAYSHTVDGNWTSNGATFANTGSTIGFTGSSAQTIGGTSALEFNNLTIASPNGVTLGNDLNVNGSLLLTSGIVTTGNYTLTVGSEGNVSSGSSSKYIDGKLALVYGGTGSKTFPIGKGGNYRPLTLVYTALTGTSTVTAEQLETTIPGSKPSNATAIAGRYWTVTESGSTARTYNLTLDGTGSPARVLNIFKGDGETNTVYFAAKSENSYTHEGFTSFSNFALGNWDLITWDGSADEDWANAANWDVNEVPLDNDNVRIEGSTPHNPVITAWPASPATVNDLTIESGAVVMVNPGKALTVNGSLVNNGGTAGLVIKSDETGTGSLIHHTDNIDGTFERFMNNADWTNYEDGWHQISAPVTDQAIDPEFTLQSPDDLKYDFYCWDEATNKWINFRGAVSPTWPQANVLANGLTSNTANFLTGKGYMAAYDEADTKIFSGKLNTSDVIISSLPNTNGGWHLLGNPFASALIWDAANPDWNATHIDGVAKVWNEAYQSYSDINSGSGLSSEIPASNGFMICVTEGESSGSLTIPASRRVHTTKSFYKSAVPGLKLVVHNLSRGNAQESNLWFNPEATENFDPMHDGVFLAGYGPVFHSMAGDVRLSTNSLPELSLQTRVPFFFSPNDGGTSFNIEAEGVTSIPGTVWILDKKINTDHNLTQNPVYPFTAAAADEAGRFIVHFSSVGSEEMPAPAPVKIFAIDRQIIIRNISGMPMAGEVFVFNMIGQQIHHHRLNDTNQNAFQLNTGTGIYLVKVILKQGTYSTKVFVK